MLSNPQLGRRVRVVYAAKRRRWFPLHGRIGVVVVSGRGKPRNHAVMIGGVVYSIPCGNLIDARAPGRIR